MKDSGVKLLAFLPLGVASAEVGGVQNPKFAEPQGVRAGMTALEPKKSCEKLTSGSENIIGVESEEAKKSRGGEVAPAGLSHIGKSCAPYVLKAGRFLRRSRSSDEIIESCWELLSIESFWFRVGEF